MRKVLVVLVAAIALPTVAAEQLDVAVANARAERRYCAEDLHDPDNIVCRAVKAGGDGDAVAGRVARELRITPASARAVTLALLANGPSADAATIAEAEAEVRAALKTEPHRAPMIATLAQLAPREKHREALAAIVPLIGDDTEAAIAAAAATPVWWWDESAELFLAPALQRHRDDLDIIEAIGWDAPEVAAAAFGPLEITKDGVRLRPHAASAGAAALNEHLARQISAITRLNDPRLLIAVYEALPPQVITSLLSGHDLPYLTLDVVAAALLTGRLDLAQRLLAQTAGGGSARELLLASMPGARSDPFDLFTKRLAAFGGEPDGMMWQLLLARYAEQHGYPAYAAELLDDILPAHDGDIAAVVPQPLHDAARVVIDSVTAATQAQRARRNLLAPPRAEVVTRSSIAAPRIVPFTEHRLEEAGQSAESPVVIDCSDAERVAATTHLPPHTSPIRMERNGADVVAIVISPALDPIGEVGLGGYWVLRSQDGGATWQSWYTGLRENMPYVIPQSSRLPLMAGDHLRIEVEVKELDTSSITFPPIALQTKRTATGLYIHFPWAELTRDSDGDGLSDLMEERLTTDPHDADTDGDGVPDGADLLPRVAAQQHSDVRAEILAAALGGFGLGGGRAVEGLGGAAAESSCTVTTSHVVEPVLFLAGDASSFAALVSSRRMIVLSPDELEAYNKKFGPTYAAQIRHFVVETSGTRAIIELNERWKSVTYLVTKTPEGWKATEITGWIS